MPRHFFVLKQLVEYKTDSRTGAMTQQVAQSMHLPIKPCTCSINDWHECNILRVAEFISTFTLLPQTRPAESPLRLRATPITGMIRLYGRDDSPLRGSPLRGGLRPFIPASCSARTRRGRSPLPLPHERKMLPQSKKPTIWPVLTSEDGSGATRARPAGGLWSSMRAILPASRTWARTEPPVVG